MLASSGACAATIATSAFSISTSLSASESSSSTAMMPWATCASRVPVFSTTPQPKLRVPGSSPRTVRLMNASSDLRHLFVGHVEVCVDVLHVVVIVDGIDETEADLCVASGDRLLGLREVCELRPFH